MEDNIKEFLNKIKEINVLNLKEDDKILVTLKSINRPASKVQEYMKKYQQFFSNIFKNKIIVITEDAKFEIIKD